MDRRWLGVGMAVAAGFLGGSPHPGAQAHPPGSDGITWTAEWKFDTQPPRDYERGRVGTHVRWRVRFNGVQKAAGPPSTGAQRGWLSRQYEWDYQEYFEDTGFARHPENNWRFLARFTRTCTNSGTVNLGATEGEHNEGLSTVQPTCVHTQDPIAEGYAKTDTLPGGTKHILNHLLPWPRRGCADGEARREQEADGTITSASWSVTVSRGVIDARVEVGRGEYEAFVPEPGKTLTSTAQSSRPARFRFVLDEQGTSRFPGYATNANVDDVFFVKHNLGHLRGQYANDGPDVIFDPERFSATAWSRREPAAVETRAADTTVSAPVTAMDYGAVGRLRAYAESPDCAGSWQPVKILVNGQPHDALDLPLDADGNLIADALEQYRGLESGADVDAEPKGNGMAGDGLTTFEEYRGFLTRGAACYVPPAPPLFPDMPEPEPFPDAEADLSSLPPGWNDEHIRTTPRRKDFFVLVEDPELALLTHHFAWASDLSVHLICEHHFVDSDTRIINFTLQQLNLREWRGKRISQEEPQHGIPVFTIDFRPDGLIGVAATAEPGSERMGPPKFSAAAFIYKPSWPSRTGQALEGLLDLRLVLAHELLHAVGVPHHSDHIEDWRVRIGTLNVTTHYSVFQRDGGSPPLTTDDTARRTIAQAGLGGLLVLGATDCEEHRRMYRHGQFVGCWATSIARRGQQNSGDFDCPMRYAGSDRYEAPGSTAMYRWTDYVGGPGPGHMIVDAWAGKLLKYRNDLDRWGMGQLCSSTRGTEINAQPGDMNHNGNAGRDKPCREFLVVNDLAARGVR